jgi:uncharacterized protein
MDTHMHSFRKLWPPIQEEKKRYRAESSFFSCRLCEQKEYPGSDGTRAKHAILYFEMVEGYANDELGIYIPKNSITFAYYWTERPYNLYHWIAPEGHTIGYYFNICDQVQIGLDGISWRDLILDVYVEKEEVRILDEDEIPDDIEPGILNYIRESTDEILLHYKQIISTCSGKSQTLWNMGCIEK